MPPFKLGINMAGAVSAGAYTAGVLDYLTEVLDDWYAQKKAGATVPFHDVSIEVFTGASAGGMCAAISSILLQDEFEHISDTTQTGTTNRFYESWVNKIDIQPLLGSDDLTGDDATVKSLLDSTIIEEIAQYALTRGTPLATPRPYVSPDLNIFLSLTNLRGVPYNIVSVAPGSVEESTFFYGDRIRFQTSSPGSSISYPPAPRAERVLDLSAAGSTSIAWQTLQTAAMATGAFPVFLKPRVLSRYQSEYTPPGWESVASAETGTPPTTPPHFPDGMPDPFQTVNVDGGVTNNDPFNYAHDFLLASITPPLTGPDKDHLPSSPDVADRAVLSIAPFPTTQVYATTGYDTEKNSSVLLALPSLFSALISQSRFFGQSLSKLLSGSSFSNFIIAPSDDDLRQKFAKMPDQMPPALQCAALSAFGGFFERGFRAHDFALGRRNCQKFLLDHFLLPQDNTIIAPSLPKDPVALQTLLKTYGRPDPRISSLPGFDPTAPIPLEQLWLPIVPICSAALQAEVPAVARFQMTEEKLDIIVDLIFSRFKAVVSALLKPVPAPWHFLISSIVPTIVHFAGSGPLKNVLIEKLGESYKE